MVLRPFLNDAGSCASYLFGCTTHHTLAVVDAHADLVDDYITEAESIGSPIVAVFETHVQADHVSGLPELVALTGATGYLPELRSPTVKTGRVLVFAYLDETTSDYRRANHAII